MVRVDDIDYARLWKHLYPSFVLSLVKHVCHKSRPVRDCVLDPTLLLTSVSNLQFFNPVMWFCHIFSWLCKGDQKLFVTSWMKLLFPTYMICNSGVVPSVCSLAKIWNWYLMLHHPIYCYQMRNFMMMIM